jgi:hypothetical protein
MLPDWPEPMHVFASPELKITLPDGQYYAAARSTAGGAPFRAITVRDTIGDLPKVENGASKLTLEVTAALNHLFSFFSISMLNELLVILCSTEVSPCPGSRRR